VKILKASASTIHTKLLLIVLAAILLPFALVAQNDLPDPMSPPRMVNDFSGIFDSQQRSALESKLRNYHNQTTVQIYVVTVNSLNGDAAYNYAAQLGEKWGIGQKGKDNGVLILIKPKTKEERGNVFIAPGYGLEASLNDSYCGRIIDNEMIPALKNNDYYTAADNAVDAIIARLEGDDASGSSNDAVNQQTPNGNPLGFSDIFFTCILLPLIIICMIIFPRFRAFVFFILMLFFRGGGRGGGGGFGGGGGGRFGGGGAGRSW